MRAFTLGASAGSAELNRTESGALTVGFVVLLVILAVAAANAIFGIGGTALGTVVREWLSGVVYILVAAIVALRAVRDRTQRRFVGPVCGGPVAVRARKRVVVGLDRAPEYPSDPVNQ